MEEQRVTVSVYPSGLRRIKYESLNETSVSHQNRIAKRKWKKTEKRRRKYEKKGTRVEMNTISSVHPKLDRIKVESPNETPTSSQNEMTAIKKLKERKTTVQRSLNKFVCFVLRSFESMHYLHLEKCINYTDIGSKTFHREFSETELVIEYFKNIPGTFMDESGFLFLKDPHISTKFPKQHKMKLLTVCILAFENEMHFTVLVSKAIDKSRVGYFHSMSIVDQLNFFKKHPIFEVSESGFVKLKPDFKLAEISLRSLRAAFENAKQNAFLSSNTDEQCKTDSLAPPDPKRIKFESQSQMLDSYQNEKTGNETATESKTSAEIRSISSVYQILERIKLKTQTSGKNKMTAVEKLEIRKKAAERRLNKYVCFILRCFESIHYFHLKKCISFAEIGSKNFLSQLSQTEIIDYFKNIPGTFMDENGFLFLIDQDAETNFRKNWRKMRLLTVCILAFENEMHFSVLVNKAIEKSGVRYFQGMSIVDRLNFFKKHPMFIVSESGFVKLKPGCKLSKISSGSLCTAFKNTKQSTSMASNLEEQCKTDSSFPKRIKVESQSRTLESSQNEVTSNETLMKKGKSAEVRSISLVRPQSENIEVDSTNQTSMRDQNENTANQNSREGRRPFEITLIKYVCFLLKYMKSMHYLALKEIICYAEPGCKMFLDQFSEEEQTEYFKNIPNTVMGDSGFLLFFPGFPKKGEINIKKISKFIKMMLLTVCILAFEEELYFKVLVNKIIGNRGSEWFHNMSSESQLNFFKKDRRFVVSELGFVKLNPSFKLPKVCTKSLSTASEETKQNCTRSWFSEIKMVL